MKNILVLINVFLGVLLLSCDKQQPAYPPVLGDGIAEVTSSEVILKSSFKTTEFEAVSECGFVVGRDTIFNEYTKVMSKKVASDFSCTLENIDSIDSGKYYAKSYAKNRIGTGYGNLFSFEIVQVDLPTVQTFDATNIGTSIATLNGYVWTTGNNSITACGFVYGTNANNLTQNVSGGIGAGNLSETITGLTANTNYYYKAYATNSAGTAYGDVKQFRTTSASQKPTVVTNSATNITSNSATLNGNVTSAGGATVTSRGFVYGTSSTNLSSNIQSGSGTGSYYRTLTGLSQGTTYYYKAYATNSAGTEYGDIRQFTTIAIYAPTVQTNAASGITTNSATLNGNVTSDGGTTVTSRGFVYGTSPSNLSLIVQSGSGTGSYNKSVTGLAAGTTYYFKAYATNSVGTAYGEVKQFTTENSGATTGTLNGHDWVDLGLPSGTKWATCNVGAVAPAVYGYYYAWGETTPKSTYTSSNYTYTSNPTTLPSSADAATANWGAGWRMPTKTEMLELIDNCTVTWTTQNGVNGCLFTGSNGNSIFLPAAGERSGSELGSAGSQGCYWSSSLSGGSSYAVSLFFNLYNCDRRYKYRYYGQSVRAVCNPR
ncbi:MAG: hypothetical protein IKP45_13495 [Bacteroidales bacterium]|nr:hypothetical protein [Bacteroidales bacterium]